MLNTGDVLYGYDEDGNRLWTNRVGTYWNVVGGAPLCGMWIEPNMGRKIEVGLNVHTGRIEKATRASLGDAKRYLDLGEPSLAVSPTGSVVWLLDEDGEEVWTFDPPAGVDQALDLGDRYVVVTGANVVVGLDGTGAELWRREEGIDCRLERPDGDLRLVADDGSLRLRLDDETGEVLEVLEGPDGVTADDVE